MSLSDELTQLQESISGVGTAVKAKDTANATAITAETSRAEDGENALALLIAGCPEVKIGRFVGNAAEQAAAMAAVPNQATVFNNWYRFSHSNAGAFPATASELTAWAYDSTTGQIHDTLNSTTAIGVLSTEKYTDYVLDVSLRSTDSDDDLIGVLLAWYKDPVTGQEYTLTASRTPGGNGPLWGVTYNVAQGATYGQKTVVDKSATVHYGNGASGNQTAAAAGYVTNTPTTGWSGQATQWSTDGHTRIYAVRQGNIITLKTSLFEQPDTLLDSTLITVDLTSDPVLAKFQGPSSYGFVAYSQANSYWLVNQFTNTQDTIFNLATGLAYQNLNGTWTQTTAISWASIPANCLLVNMDTGKMFFVKDQNNVVEFRTPSLIANGTVGTPDLGDNGTGNDRGIVPIAGSTSLTGDVFGYTYQTNAPTAAISTALPVASSANIAKKLTFFNSSTFNWTLTAGNFNTGYGSNTTSIVLPPNSTIVLEHDGVSYNGIAGTGQIGPKSTVSSAAPSGGANGDTWYQV